MALYDPQAVQRRQGAPQKLGYRESALAAARGADLVLLLTEWEEFRQMDPQALAEVVHGRSILDGRNALDPFTWRAAGWTYRALGQP